MVMLSIDTPPLLKPLDSVHPYTRRLITTDTYSTHHCITNEEAGQASLTLRRDSLWFLFIYKGLNGDMPSCITSLLNRLRSLLHPFK